MNPAWITRAATLSAAGRGVEALTAAVAAGRPLTTRAPWAWDGLAATDVARLPAGLLDVPDTERAEALLDAVVHEILPDDRRGVGLIVGTSSGAICGGFEAWRRGEGPGGTGWRQRPGCNVAARHGLAPVLTTSVACASGAMIFVLAEAWLGAGVCERVIVAGFDTLSVYIHAGFAGLGALSPTRCRPFAPDRDGLLLGEGAAAFLVETPEAATRAGRTALAELLGVGMSQDGVHLTAPDRTGDGLYRAAAAALVDAGVDAAAIDTVSAHATGTVHNDAMEARALARLFGETPVPVHVVKPVIGHTLGAAGALEVAEILGLFAGGPHPAPPPGGASDCPVRFAPTRTGLSGRPTRALTVNAAFGGVNVALVLGAPRDPAQPGRASPYARTGGDIRPPTRLAHVEGDTFPLATLLGGGAPPALGRTDTYVRAGIAALARAAPAPEATIVLSSVSDCAAADLRYYDALLRDGPARASRLHFAYTTPGAPLAEAAILLHLRGPAVVVCGTPADGAATAAALVAAGLAPSVLHLHVEAPAAHAVATVTRFPGLPS